MAHLESKIKENNSIRSLEHKLNLKQLQLNGLLNITQAINDNIKEAALFQMYTKFITWELGVKKMALFIQKEDGWNCVSSAGINENKFDEALFLILQKFHRPSPLDTEKHKGIKQFDLIIPVHHKDIPIAYALIGEVENTEDYYGKILFITTITNIIAVAIENKRLFKKQLVQERLNREMELASDVQHMLIPSSLPGNKHFELSSFYKPHIGVGGDYFDCIQLTETSLIICVGDISGKGLAAAMLMSNFQASLHVLLTKDTQIEGLVHELNQAIFKISGGERYITFFIAKIDALEQSVEYINAGHIPPLANIDGEITELHKGSTILGGFEKLPFLETGHFKFKKSCTFLCYTDGITDILNNKGDYFSDKLVFDIFKKSKEISPKDFIKKLNSNLNEFKEEQEFTDDMTVLVCKVKP